MVWSKKTTTKSAIAVSRSVNLSDANLMLRDSYVHCANEIELLDGTDGRLEGTYTDGDSMAPNATDDTKQL